MATVLLALTLLIATVLAVLFGQMIGIRLWRQRHPRRWRYLPVAVRSVSPHETIRRSFPGGRGA